MLKKAALFALSTMLAGPALAGGPVFVAAGEHGDFSRIVLSVGAKDGRVEQVGRDITIYLPTDVKDVNLDELTLRHRAHRISTAEKVPTPDGAAIQLKINCDCQVYDTVLPNGKTVIDIIEPQKQVENAATPGAPTKLAPASKPEKTAQPAAPKPVKTASTAADEQPKPKTQLDSEDAEDTLSVDQARDRMLELLQQAAADGLITIREDAQTPLPEKLAPPKKDDKLAEHLVLSSEDRRQAAEIDSNGCYADAAFHLDNESFEETPLVAISELQNELGAAADKQARLAAAEKLAGGYLAIGFGDEAFAVLRSYGRIESLRAQMALIVSDRPLPEKNDITPGQGCGGAHALWQAASAPADEAVGYAMKSKKSVKKLPKRLRALIATRIAQKMADAENWGEAMRFFEVAADASEVFSPELTFVEAQIKKHDGDKKGSKSLMRDLAAENNTISDDALLKLAEEYADAGAKSHDGFYEDIGALQKTNPNSDKSAKAAFLEAVAWANDGNIEASIILLRNIAANDEERQRLALLKSREIIVTALDSKDQDKQLEGLSAYLNHRSFVDQPDDDIAFRKKIAMSAAALGLPNVAFKALSKTAVDQDEAAALTLATSALNADAPDRALAAAASNADKPAFAEVIVEANMRLERNFAALAAATALPESDRKAALTAQSAWRAGDFASANRAFAALDPALIGPKAAIQYALAAYMSGEQSVPSIVEAVLNEQNPQALEGVRRLFMDEIDASVLAEGQSIVENLRKEIEFIEEAMTHG